MLSSISGGLREGSLDEEHNWHELGNVDVRDSVRVNVWNQASNQKAPIRLRRHVLGPKHPRVNLMFRSSRSKS